MRVLTLLLLTGCSEAKMDIAGRSELASADSYVDTGYDADDESLAEEEPVHWLLSGALQVVSGTVITDQSALVVTVVGTVDTELCVDNVTMVQSDVVDEMPEPDMEGWWHITVVEDPESCLAGFDIFGEDDSFFLGVGPLHPEIRAVMGSNPDLADVSVDTIHSVFASLDEDGPLWVFGIAGTLADFSGDIEATIPGEISDGLWSFHALYGFPFAAE
jgi:hypothetical protein